MRIKLSPYAPLPGSNETLKLEKSQGDRLRINGELFNFNPLPDGGTIPEGTVPSDVIIGPVERIDGEVHITLRLPVPGHCTDQWMCFPDPMIVTDDGPIDVPFATYETVTEEPVAGGTKITRTRHVWRQAPEVTTVTIPNEEPANVEP